MDERTRSYVRIDRCAIEMFKQSPCKEEEEERRGRDAESVCGDQSGEGFADLRYFATTQIQFRQILVYYVNCTVLCAPAKIDESERILENIGAVCSCCRPFFTFRRTAHETSTTDK